MISNRQAKEVLKYRVGDRSYEIFGSPVACSILRSGFALAGSDGRGGVFVSEDVPSSPYDFRFPMAVHEYAENYIFWELNPAKSPPEDLDEAHMFAIQNEINAAESLGKEFLREYLDFMLTMYDDFIGQGTERSSTEREEQFREIYIQKRKEI